MVLDRIPQRLRQALAATLTGHVVGTPTQGSRPGLIRPALRAPEPGGRHAVAQRPSRASFIRATLRSIIQRSDMPLNVGCIMFPLVARCARELPRGWQGQGSGGAHQGADGGLKSHHPLQPAHLALVRCPGKQGQTVMGSKTKAPERTTGGTRHHRRCLPRGARAFPTLRSLPSGRGWIFPHPSILGWRDGPFFVGVDHFAPCFSRRSR